jgi:cytochrome c biogenesis protein
MKRSMQRLASPRLTLAGFGLLAAAILLTHDRADAPALAIAGPLGLLALNLAAALALRPALRRGGLGLFHVALLALLLLVGAGRLTHFDARVEVAEATLLDPAQIEVTGRGPWHGDGWRRLQFRQGAYEVAYAAGMKRSHTRSLVRPGAKGEGAEQTVGDDTPLVIDGYRFYTTHNKGLAPVLTWRAPSGDVQQGALHMPAYPLYDWKQENAWTAPDGTALRFWLRIESPLPERAAWTLDPRALATVLVVEAPGLRRELRPGESVAIGSATLRYERLSGWMGYRIFYDPTLLPMLVVCLLGVAGLGWHLWRRGVGIGAALHEGAIA